MRTNSFSALATVAVAATIATFAAGCNGNPGAGSTAYKQGELNNGGFLFQCDDSVACDRWSTSSAKDFPDIVATGANFNVRFVSSGDQSTITVSNSNQYNGTTISGLAPFLSNGDTEGLSTIKPGYGTIVAKNAQGAIVDFVTIKVVKPKSFILYDAKYKGNDPSSLQKITLTKDQTQEFRTVAEHGPDGPIAGSIRVSWEIPKDGQSVAEVVSYSRGVATIKGKAAGKTTVTVKGAGDVEKTIDVEVTEVPQ